MPERDDNQWSQTNDRVMRAVGRLNKYCDLRYKGTVLLDSLKIRFPDSEGGDVQVVLTAWVRETGDAVVGFHGGYDVADALIGLTNRLQSGKLKWRDDEYRDSIEPGTGSGTDG